MRDSDRTSAPELDERLLVLVKGARDAELTKDLLTSEGLEVTLCSNMSDLCALAREGAACLVVAEEMLSQETYAELAALFADQPAWSDLPLVVFSDRTRVNPAVVPRTLAKLGNVVLLDRPIRVRSMLVAMHAAIRSRRRQYEARRAIDARDTFLAMLGHELRNPLAAIRLAVTMLEEKWEGEPRPKELTIAARQSEHLRRLVNDLLDVARVTHGKLALNRSTIDLVEVVRSTLELFDPSIKDSGLVCSLSIAQAPIWVDGDRVRLDQVFTNLLSNAVKYTPPGGSIEVDVRTDAENAIVTVKDSGAGLASEMLEPIFDIFTQAEVSADRSKGGIGIGLSLVRSLLRLHGGEVEAESAGLNQGSTFRVRIPTLATRRLANSPVERTSTSTSGKKRVVVVEDNEDVRELLRLMLELHGHNVAGAEDGPNGLEQILALNPDVAFVDLGLPKFDGLELARRVRAAGSTVRLVALSGYGQPKDKELAAKAGFDEHLTKPVSPTDVERALARSA